MNDQTQNAWKRERKRLKTPIFHGTPSVGIAGIFCSGIFVAGMLRGWGAEDGDPWKILPDGGWRWPPGTRPRPPLAGGGRGDTQHPVPPPLVPPPVVRSGPAGARCRIPAVKWESSLLITYLAGN